MPKNQKRPAMMESKQKPKSSRRSSVPRKAGKPPSKSTGSADAAVLTVAKAPEVDDVSAKPFPVVGIGASAGGLEAFTRLLRSLPADTGMSFVLVQHLDPAHPSMLQQLLARDTRMPVTEVTDGTSVEPNHVYVIPPNRDIKIHNGVLRLTLRTIGQGPHAPIDTFLCALAQDQKTKAIGIILSGVGSDGTKGLQAIKAEGGITLVQDEQSATYPGMPLHALGAGCVDLILPPEKIAEELAGMIRHPYLKIAPQPKEKELAFQGEANLAKIFHLLRSATGVDFENYKQATIRRRITRRMLVRRCETFTEYAAYLAEHSEELHTLFEDMLIHVTSFFRDPEVYDYLKTVIFPRIYATLEPSEPIRIWVPGCSGGEEVYSIAIVLHEFLGEGADKTRIQIFGTDVSEVDIDKARTAIYSDSEVAGLSSEQLSRFFVKVENGHQISKSIRDSCVFSRHDVTRDPPFSRMDLVSCRNLLIYFNTVLQKKALHSIHYSLKPTGFLALGKSESVSAAGELFSDEDRRASIYSKVALPVPVKLDFESFETPRQAAVAPKSVTLPKTTALTEAERVILERYAPAGFVVTADLQVRHFQGDASPLLRPVAGEASFSLLKLIRPDLMFEIQTAIREAKKSGSVVRREGIRFKHNDHWMISDLEVLPLPISSKTPNHTYFAVLFPTLRPSAHKGRTKITAGSKKEKVNEQERLKQELAATQIELRNTIENREASEEELRAASEEVLSSNEELQSTNEELATAKEELQSTNEELTTVNDELSRRNIELTHTASDLNNLLESVKIPIVIVSNDRTLRRFTSEATKLFNVIPSDIGRPIDQIRPKLDLPDLDNLLVQVIRTLRGCGPNPVEK
jgi:two-component system CheB/CheR fusion protein